MAEEPQPTSPPVPAAGSTEDRKAAAALSNLDASHDDDVAAGKPTAADTAALSNAVSNLRVDDGGEGRGKGSTAAGGEGGQAGDDAKTKKVKVEPADVAFLVEQLELSKGKATEILKSCGGDRAEAVRAFVIPAR